MTGNAETITLDQIDAEVDEIYSRFTAATIEAVKAFSSETDGIQKKMEALPEKTQVAALALMKIREKQMEREVEEATV